MDDDDDDVSKDVDVDDDEYDVSDVMDDGDDVGVDADSDNDVSEDGDDDEEFEIRDVMNDGDDDEEFEVDDDEDDDVNGEMGSIGIEFALTGNDKSVMIIFVVNLSLHSSSNHVKRREKELNLYFSCKILHSCPLLLSKPTVGSTLLHTSVSTGHEPSTKATTIERSFQTAKQHHLHKQNMNNYNIKMHNV